MEVVGYTYLRYRHMREVGLSMRMEEDYLVKSWIDIEVHIEAHIEIQGIRLKIVNIEKRRGEYLQWRGPDFRSFVRFSLFLSSSCWTLMYNRRGQQQILDRPYRSIKGDLSSYLRSIQFLISPSFRGKC